MQTVLQPIAVHTRSADREGRLVLINGELVAVIVRLSEGIHGEEKGRWHVEAAFDHVDKTNRTFATEAEAEAWIASRFVG